MGRREDLDLEELKFICQQIMLGRTDAQIIGELADDWGGRDKRTIRNIRRTFEAAQEVLLEKLSEIRDLSDTPSREEIDKACEIVEKMSQSLRPIKDHKTGKIMYEAWPEF